jgi:hypothetical protein
MSTKVPIYVRLIIRHAWTIDTVKAREPAAVDDVIAELKAEGYDENGYPLPTI